MKSRENLRLLWLLPVVLALGLAAGGCTLGSTPIPTPVPSGQPSSLPTAVPISSTPSKTPFVPTDAPTLLPPPHYYDISYPRYGDEMPQPTSDRPDELQMVLAEYNRVRAEAEKTLDPDLLRQVCVDPYLSDKMARVLANKQDGSHWETPSSTFTVEFTRWLSSDTVRVTVQKVETKLFFPRNASLPDDESCTGTIYSYRDCTYSAEYRLVWQNGRWYVAEATSVGDCTSFCQKDRPAATVTPTPSPSPTPAFPDTATVLSDWPALPADLYFRRDGQLWRWPAGGGEPVQLSPAETAAGQKIVEYSLVAGEKYLVYENDAGQLYVVDRAGGQQLFPPPEAAVPAVQSYQFSNDGAYLLYLAGENPIHLFELSTGEEEEIAVTGYPRQFALTPDNRYLVYLSSPLPPDPANVQAPFQAALMAIDRQDANRLYPLGVCGTPEKQFAYMGCAGFLLFPDDNRLVLTDDRGLWQVDVLTGEFHLFRAQVLPEWHRDAREVYTPVAWFPGTHQLLFRYSAQLGSVLGVWNPDADWSQALPSTGCYTDCRVEWAWAPDGIWVSPIPGTLYRAQLSPDGYVTIVYGTLSALNRGIWPTQLKPLPNGQAAFLDQRCSFSASSWQEPTLFVLEADGIARPVSSLPAFTCPPGRYLESSIYGGTAAWSPAGEAYLYLDDAGNPLLLGWTDGSVLWDVRELLAGASDFRWVGAVTPGP